MRRRCLTSHAKIFGMVKIFFSIAMTLLSISACSGQEVEGSGKSTGALFSPADYLQVCTPLTGRVGVNTYGFYVGNIRAGIALIEVPVTLQKHLSVTPSYLFVSVPPEGLSLLTNKPAFQTYQEHQFRLAGAITTEFHKFILSNRNMYVRRFTPSSDVNRYRSKFYIARRMSVASYHFTPFLFEEVYHDFVPGALAAPQLGSRRRGDAPELPHFLSTLVYPAGRPLPAQRELSRVGGHPQDGSDISSPPAPPCCQQSATA